MTFPKNKKNVSVIHPMRMKSLIVLAGRRSSGESTRVTAPIVKSFVAVAIANSFSLFFVATGQTVCLNQNSIFRGRSEHSRDTHKDSDLLLELTARIHVVTNLNQGLPLGCDELRIAHLDRL